ncbi:MAG: hypothetical protein ACJ79P_11145 [Myxococcales bacterium]
MPDEADELILKMRHLEAQARAGEEARRLEERGRSLKSRAQQMAWAAQSELEAAEKQQRDGEEKIEQAKTPGTPPLDAADLLVEGKRLAAEGRTRAVKARARLNYLLDQLDESERAEIEALRASARAETHGQLADDPLFSKAPPGAGGEGGAA